MGRVATGFGTKINGTDLGTSVVVATVLGRRFQFNHWRIPIQKRAPITSVVFPSQHDRGENIKQGAIRFTEVMGNGKTIGKLIVYLAPRSDTCFTMLNCVQQLIIRRPTHSIGVINVHTNGLGGIGQVLFGRSGYRVGRGSHIKHGSPLRFPQGRKALTEPGTFAVLARDSGYQGDARGNETR
eukprot:scaffold5520_cov167-Amphora_coffeaeformis.AAC.8